MPPVWFPRMGDIPGLDYEPLVDVDRSQLAGHDAVPEVRRFDLDGEITESLWWEYIEDGEEVSTTASPAHGIAFSSSYDSEASVKTMVTRLAKGLELPGEPSDYHFAIQSAAAQMWSARRDDPEAMNWFERLGWLDIDLVRAVPDAVRNKYGKDRPDESEYYRISAFQDLVALYSREGFLADAAHVAELAREFGQGDELVTSLAEKLANLQAEDEV